ncbi:hypothetical protein GCM10009851_09000 [Herbiconiux moechotypicola]|uniref:Uncharacterized protein n=2 Tax=Herbiconiux moechotypicola TaxID=637393 RepID=A0ABN3DC06_9MICO
MAQGIAVILSVVAAMAAGMLFLYLFYSHGYECPTVVIDGVLEATEARTGWWPVGISCQRSDGSGAPDWGLTLLLLIGLGTGFASIPLWVRLARTRGTVGA